MNVYMKILFALESEKVVNYAIFNQKINNKHYGL